MARLIILAACLFAALAFHSVECFPAEGFSSNVEIVQNITDYLRSNPGVQLQALAKEVVFDGPTPRVQLVHRLGNRINGDRVVASDSGSQRWSTVQDVRKSVNYPASGIGAVTTYLEIVVDQSSNLGQAYVTSGGIGQRQISFVIEARQTLYFNHRITLYGY